jgi:hypothetical protein
LEASREREKREQRFSAALQGVEIPEDNATASFEEVKRRAEAKARGISEEKVELEEIGFQLIDE